MSARSIRHKEEDYRNIYKYIYICILYIEKQREIVFFYLSVVLLFVVVVVVVVAVVVVLVVVLAVADKLRQGPKPWRS